MQQHCSTGACAPLACAASLISFCIMPCRLQAALCSCTPLELARQESRFACQQTAGKDASGGVATGAVAGAGLATGPTAATSSAEKVRAVHFIYAPSQRLAVKASNSRTCLRCPFLYAVTGAGLTHMPQRTCCHACSLLRAFTGLSCCRVVRVALHYKLRKHARRYRPHVPDAPTGSCRFKRMRHITDVAELPRFPSDKAFPLCVLCQQQVVPCFL